MLVLACDKPGLDLTQKPSTPHIYWRMTWLTSYYPPWSVLLSAFNNDAELQNYLALRTCVIHYDLKLTEPIESHEGLY